MTPNKEDYLKCIYEIGTDMQKITNKEIAARIDLIDKEKAAVEAAIQATV